MYVSYRPEDGEAQEWDFNPDRVRQSEGELVEKRYGGKYDEWKVDVVQGGLRARRVLLWHLIRRAHPHLRYEDTPDFYVGEVTVEMDLAEIEATRAGIENVESLPAEDKARMLAGLEVAAADARAREEARGKAPSGAVPSS